MDKLSNHIKEKFSLLPLNYLKSVESLLITDCHNIKREKFKNLITIFEENNLPELIKDYETIFLTIFLLDVFKDFNREVMAIFKNSKKDELLSIIINKLILDTFHVDNNLDPYLKIRIKLFNCIADFYKQNKLESQIIVMPLFKCYLAILKDIQIKVNYLTPDLTQPLILFFKIFFIFCRHIDKKNNSIITLASDIRNQFSTILFEKEFPFFYKDLQFSSATVYFNLLNTLNNREEYIENSNKLILKSVANMKKAFLYFKAANINSPKDCYELNTKFIEISVKEINLKVENQNFENYFNFFKYFLTTDHIFDQDLTSMINDIFIILIKKYLNNNLKKMMEDKILELDIIRLVFEKMKRDKFNFSVFDENYLIIIELFHEHYGNFKKSNEEFAFKYLNDALNSGEKINRSECRIFKLFHKTEKEKTILSDFLSLIFKDINIRSFNLVFEYFKILSDIFLKQTQNFQSYDYFAKYYSEYFIRLLFKIDTKLLKLLSNMLVNFEKFDKNFYGLLINNFHLHNIHNNEKMKEEDYFNKAYSILFCLMKPYKNHKKILSINKKNIYYKNCIFENELSFEIPYSHIKYASYSNDRFLVIYMMETLIELDEPEISFNLIKNVMKNSLKNTYPESKSSLLKAYQVYFTIYFEKIQRSLQKKNGLTEEYSKCVIKNLEYLTDFINKNLFDRPPEQLQPILEIYHIILINYHETLKVKILSISREFIDKVINLFNNSFFNNGICLSLISLLRNSWYFIRFYSFNILKYSQFKEFLWKIKDQLYEEINRDLLSLRQTETEGASNLFMLLSFHFDDKFYSEFVSSVLKKRIGVTNSYIIENSSLQLNQNLKVLSHMSDVIDVLEENYLNTIEQANEKFNYNYSLHSFYVVMKSILEDEKQMIGKTEANMKQVELFSKIINKIYKNLKFFTKYLINNGVSEFSMENETSSTNQAFEEFLDYENKKLISIWYTTRFSIETLNLILDIISSRTFMNLILKNEENTNYFQNLLIISITLMTDYHHMGVIETLNESVLKICKILNLHENNSISNVSYVKLEELLFDKIIKEELSSTLRRSAGLPFLITTLIKSYILEEKFSFSKIKSILKLTITKLIENYKKFQFINSDAAVHSLNILRIVVYDAVLKPFVKEFVDFIILNILDGLKSENWSIKNSCMLLFSNIIKNLFHHSYAEKYIPTFVEYFSTKIELKSKIYNLMSDDSGKYNNDCLILLLNFFSKLKKTKNNEIDNADLKKFIQLIFNLSNHNNNFVRKITVDALITLYGININELVLRISQEINIIKNEMLSGELIINKNCFDFLIEFLIRIIKSKEIELAIFVKNFECILDDIQIIFFKLDFIENKNDKNYMYFYHISKLLNVIFKNNVLISSKKILERLISIIRRTDLNKIDVFNMISKKSNVPFFYKSLKNIIKLYMFENVGMFLENFSKEIETFLIEKYTPNKNLELLEIITFYLSRYHKYFVKFSSKSIMKILLQGKIFKDVNVTSKLLDFLIKTNIIEVFSQEELLSLSRNLLSFIEKNPSVTKLNRKILLLLSNIYCLPLKSLSKNIDVLDYRLISEIYSYICLLRKYSHSQNEEKLRYNSLTALNNILTQINYVKSDEISFVKNLLKEDSKRFKLIIEKIIIEVLLIFTLTLNDEHPEIRAYSAKIFHKLNKICLIVNPSPFLNSEYIMRKFIPNVKIIEQKLNTLLDNNFENISIEFYSIIIRENLYFEKVNSEDKVFYFEPDNRFIDNVQIKTDTFNSLVKNNLNLFLPIQLNAEKSKNLGIMIMLEDFTQLYQEKIINYINMKTKKTIDSQSFRNLIYNKFLNN